MLPRNDLTAREVAELPPGKTYRVSRNLYLRNEPPNRSWIMIYRSPVTHKHTEMGLGSYPLISVPAARAAVKEHQLAIFHGRCPLAEKRAKRGPTAGGVHLQGGGGRLSGRAPRELAQCSAPASLGAFAQGLRLSGVR